MLDRADHLVVISLIMNNTVRWGGIFINNFIAQFQLSTSVKELWKSVNI